MASNLGALMRSATAHPLVLAGGVAGVGLMAVVATLRGKANTPATTTPPADPNADPLNAGSSPDSAYPAGTGSFGAPGYDPFGGMGTSIYPTTDPNGGVPGATGGMTADGCSWPPPAVPAELVGKGSWQCSNSSWVWNWINPPGTTGGGTTRGGCPLPKPTLSPALIGKYAFHCVAGKWQLVPTTPTGVPPPVIKPPVIAPNVAAGTHATYAGHVTAQRKLIIDSRTRTVITLAHAAHWNLGAPVTGDTTPNKTGGLVKVRKIVNAPGHTALNGRYLKV